MSKHDFYKCLFRSKNALINKSSKAVYITCVMNVDLFLLRLLLDLVLLLLLFLLLLGRRFCLLRGLLGGFFLFFFFLLHFFLGRFLLGRLLRFPFGGGVVLGRVVLNL